MPIQVLPASDADMDRIFEVGSLAFGQNEPIWNAAWPNHWTPAGRKTGGERMRLTKNSDPNTTYLKAVDESSGQIMGMAKWLIYIDCPFPDRSKILGVDGDYWENDEDRKYNQQLGQVFLEHRDAAIKRTNGNIVSLDILAVDPAHQKKGAGDALVNWGVSKADELGLEAVVESSPFGRRLYERNGFVFVEDVEVQVPHTTDRPSGSIAWMTRPKKSC